ncbi:MAG: alpha/beta hydrolase, partial [Chloroflexota bacterium]
MVRRIPRTSALAGALVAVVLLPAAAFALVTNGRGQTHVSAQGSLTWVECGAPYQCATLRVPLDYADANSRMVELALVRTPAKDPSRRIGSLLVNPGGPGASGVDFARSIAPAFPVEVRDRFDIVGFDPRGVAASTPLLCHDNIQALAASEPEPSNDDQWAEVTRITRDFA